MLGYTSTTTKKNHMVFLTLLQMPNLHKKHQMLKKIFNICTIYNLNVQERAKITKEIIAINNNYISQ